MTTVVQWWERHQIALYIAALVVGAVIGLTTPGLAGPAETIINPVLALLLYATFLGVPFTTLGAALKDWRFLLTMSAVNFLVVPAVVFGLTRFIAHDQVLLIGVLFVLLTPCIDYVIVFTGLAGGAQDRLLAAAPVLMLGQMLLLPLYLWLFVGSEFVDAIDLAPFIEAFITLIVIPLLLAALTQFVAARSRVGQAIEKAVSAAMVPIMMLTLATVLISQIHGVSQELSLLLQVVPLYLVFAAVMTPIGILAGRIARLDAPGLRAVTFSGVTRNSLVVLPLVLALPPAFDLAPLVVVTQTLVELVVMVVFIRLVPRLVPHRASSPTPDANAQCGA